MAYMGPGIFSLQEARIATVFVCCIFVKRAGGEFLGFAIVPGYTVNGQASVVKTKNALLIYRFGSPSNGAFGFPFVKVIRGGTLRTRLQEIF